MSLESGVPEIYVRPSQRNSDGVWKVSDGWGDKPIWSPDGKKIYYHGRNDEMIAVSVSVGDTFEKGKSEVLFKGDYFAPGSYRRFDIHPDGDHFLMIRANKEE